MPVFSRLPLLVLVFVGWLLRPALAKPPGELPVVPEPLPFELVVQPQDMARPVPRAARQPVHVVPGAGLQLLFELTCTGKQPVTVFWGRAPYNNWVQLTVETPGGRTLVTPQSDPPLRPETAGENEIVTLQPGDTVQGRFTANAWSQQNFSFHEPGIHKLTASVAVFVADGDTAAHGRRRSVHRC